MVDAGPEKCSICAWRATCAKRFNVSGKDVHCPDFTRDVTISDKKYDGDEKGKVG